MADNTQVLNPAAVRNGEGDVIRTIDESGVKTQVVALAATRNDGSLKQIASTSEGHIEVAIHSPRLPFGSVHSESLEVVSQADAVYGINTALVTSTTGLSVGTGANSGACTGTGNLFKAATGTTQYSFATIQGKARVRYRPGQGLVGRFAGFFSTPAASSILVAGYGTSESGYYFGYNGTSFGILHSTGGVREIQTLTVTTASTATNDYVVTLPNTATATVTATNNSSTIKTAYEISKGTYPGWKAEQIGSTVVFLADSAGAKTGVFTLAQTGAGVPAAGTCVETVAGVASTDTWIPQADWNGDKLNGTGASGYTIDPSKGNVYQIGIQYLGFGTVSCQVEVTYDNGNNAEFVTAHTFLFPNNRTTTHISQPSFPFTMAAYSGGSTTDVSVSVGSFAGLIEGKKQLTGPRNTYFGSVSSSTSAYTPIFTVRNSFEYVSRANQAVINILSVAGACKSTNGITSFYLIRNATLSAGTPNFAAHATTSCSDVDSAATACTFSNNDQVIWTSTVSESGDFIFSFPDSITIQPGDTVTLAVRSVTATSVCVGSINTREDQ